MEIVFASGNQHKGIELSEILNDHTILLPKDLSISFNFDETGTTYLENALGKASALYNQVNRPVLADDSGLSIPALGGAPGIYSARYGSEETGKQLESPDRNAYLLRNMEGITRRDGFFVCCMVLILDEYRIYTVQETFHGIIIETPKGTGGFGYDPVVYLPEYGKTVAELDPAIKNTISHRGKAGAGIRAILQSL